MLKYTYMHLCHKCRHAWIYMIEFDGIYVWPRIMCMYLEWVLISGWVWNCCSGKLLT